MYATISRIPDTFMGQIIIEQILKLVNSSISFQIPNLAVLDTELLKPQDRSFLTPLPLVRFS